MISLCCAYDELEPQLQQFDLRHPARIRCCLDWNREGKETLTGRHDSREWTDVDRKLRRETCCLRSGRSCRISSCLVMLESGKLVANVLFL